MRISDWSSDVCSSDLFRDDARFGEAVSAQRPTRQLRDMGRKRTRRPAARGIVLPRISLLASRGCRTSLRHGVLVSSGPDPIVMPDAGFPDHRSEEHTSELQSLMRISYAVFCLKKTKQQNNRH